MKKFLIILLFPVSCFSQTTWGVFPLYNTDSTGDIYKRMRSANVLGVKLLRTRIILPKYTSISNLRILIDSGFEQILNINYSDLPSQPFFKDTALYSAQLEAFLQRIKDNTQIDSIKLLVIQNEEQNPDFNTGNVLDYANLLMSATSAAGKYNLKVTNGGLPFIHLIELTYLWLKTVCRGNDADSIAIKMAFSNDKMGDLTKFGVGAFADLKVTDSLLNAYKDIPLAFINTHFYADKILPDNLFKQVDDYVSQRTGKHLISNEVGVKNYSADIVNSLMKNVSDARFQYAIFFDGFGVNAKPLTNQMQLTVNGEAFKNYLK